MKKKLISLFLVGAMTAGMVAGCGNSGNGSNAAAGNDSAAGDVASTEAVEEGTESTFDGTYSNKQVIIGESTEPNGDITPYWTNGACDYDAFKLVTGMSPIENDQTGKWIENPTVLENLETTVNEDGSETYTITIKDGLKFSDGSPVTAENYVFFNMFWASNEVMTDLEAADASANTFQYYKGYEAYSTGASDTFEGIHLIDDKTYSITIDASMVPYYYGQALIATQPQSMNLWVP